MGGLRRAKPRIFMLGIPVIEDPNVPEVNPVLMVTMQMVMVTKPDCYAIITDIGDEKEKNDGNP